MRSSFARISSGGFSLLLSAALLLMVGGLLASDQALRQAAEAQTRTDAQQTQLAVTQAVRAALDAGATPGRIGARLVSSCPHDASAGGARRRGDSRRTGHRLRRRRSPPRSERISGTSCGSTFLRPCRWTLIVTHRRSVAALRLVLWALSLTTVAFLGFGVIRERRLAIRVAERSAELERLYSEVARANTAKSEFLANISHELRTPLNAIVGFVELLKDGVYGDLSPRQVPPVDRIAASATHLRHLVDQVLDIAKIAAGRLEVHPETLVLRSFVLNIASELESLINERGLSLSIAVGASLPARANRPDAPATHSRQPDRQRGEVHARRAASRFARVSSMRLRPTRRSRAVTRPRILRSRSAPPDSRRAWVALQVVDTGVGIAPGDQERIFDEFEQVNAGPRGESMQRGTGLGLAISRRLAQLLGGNIGVDSQVGKGSTFTLWLPVHPSDLQPATPSRRRARRSQRCKLSSSSTDRRAKRALRRVPACRRPTVAGWRRENQRRTRSRRR